MNIPSFTAEAALYHPHEQHAGRARRTGRTDRHAVVPQAPQGPWNPSDPCTYGPCIPKINCIDHGGGIYDCWVESYKRQRCCPVSIWGGAPCHYTTSGCPPGHDIAP